MSIRSHLVVSTHLKNISQIGAFPRNNKYLKPPPRSPFNIVQHLLRFLFLLNMCAAIQNPWPYSIPIITDQAPISWTISEALQKKITTKVVYITPRNINRNNHGGPKSHNVFKAQFVSRSGRSNDDDP